eukprot:11169365-Lingulodinium_polyedra.AAC.1
MSIANLSCCSRRATTRTMNMAVADHSCAPRSHLSSRVYRASYMVARINHRARCKAIELSGCARVNCAR